MKQASDIKILLNQEMRVFIRKHDNDDIRDLALKTPPNPDWPYALILDQIKARQKARIKLPLWLDHHDDILFPPSDILEQASSTATARYKASLVKGAHFIDLTGGTGVDSHAFAENFNSGICVEHNEQAATLLTHNLPLLSDKPVEIRRDTAEHALQTLPNTDLIYIDPQRRDSGRKGLYKLEDCAPNVLELLPLIKSKTRYLMLKTSPIMDITTGLETLEHVSAVHCVQWRGECKELLYILDFERAPDIQNTPITAAILDDQGNASASFTFTKEQETSAKASTNMPLRYLYEPGPALQKVGAFNQIAAQYALHKLHKHTHLYTSDTLLPTFPGRVFEIQSLFPAQKKALPMDKANLTIRNFPGNTDGLRKKLNLKDGGDDYLFACTLINEQKSLIHARKARS